MAVRDVTWTILNADSEPIRRTVICHLHAGEGGGEVAAGSIVSEVRAQSEGDTGIVTFSLEPNANISPAGSWYSFTVDHTSPTIVRHYEIPAGSGAVDLDDLDQIEVVPAGVTIPKASTNPGKYLRAKADGTGYELVAVSGGGEDRSHEVAFLCWPFDVEGGDFTDVPTIAVGDLPRSALAAGNAEVAVVSGDGRGSIWTITGSGPCTEGDAIAPGDTVVSYGGGQGLIGVAATGDGTTVSEITVAAVDGEVVPAAERAASIMDQLVAQGRRYQPDRWIVGGNDYADHWYSNTLLPTPTATRERRAWVRIDRVADSDDYLETRSEPLDSGGVPAAGGNNDRDEDALHTRPDGRVTSFAERTPQGEPQEWQKSRGGPLPEFGPIPVDCWVELRWRDEAGVGTFFYARAAGEWDYGDDTDSDDTRWLFLGLYPMPGYEFSDSAPDTVEQWMQRAKGEFSMARSHVWHDDVLASHPGIEDAAGDATTLTDAALGGGVQWTARGAATVVVGGSTDFATEGYVDDAVADEATARTAAISAATSGLVPTSRTLAGLDLSANRSASDLRTALGIDLSRIPTVVRKAADQSVTSSTTLVDCTGLAFAATAGVTYYLDGYLLVTGVSAGDLAYGATHPGGTLRLDALGMSKDASSAPAGTGAGVNVDAVITASGGSQTHVGTVTGITTAVRLMGFYTATSSGTFQVQFAQRSSNMTATSILAGSFLRYHT